MSDEKFYQVVTLVLADGRRCTYTGRVQLDPVLEPEPKLVEILLSRPLPLPAGCSFDTLPPPAQEKQT